MKHTDSQLLIQSEHDCAQYMLDLIFMMLDTAHELGWNETASALDACALLLARESHLTEEMINSDITQSP